MRILLSLLLLCNLAQAFPAGAPNSAIRIPSTGGIPKAGALDISKSAAVTGLTNPFIPFWNGAGGVGLGNSDCQWNSGTSTHTCSATNFTFSGYATGTGPTGIILDSTGKIVLNDMHATLAQVTNGTVGCTTSPCTFTQNPITNAAISTITRTGTGGYSVNFTASFWTAAPTCVVGHDENVTGSVGDFICGLSSTVTTTAATVQCHKISGALSNTDGRFSIVCIGRRT